MTPRLWNLHRHPARLTAADLAAHTTPPAPLETGLVVGDRVEIVDGPRTDANRYGTVRRIKSPYVWVELDGGGFYGFKPSELKQENAHA